MNGKNRCLKMGLLVVGGVLALSALVMGLWNWLMPALFGGAVASIGFVQAVGLLILSKILFGGWRGHGRGRCGHGHGHRGFGPAAAFANMTDEEKAAFKAKMRGRCRTQPEADSEVKTEV